MIRGYPIGDWRDWEFYRRFDDADTDRFRWEFLRRNPEYQADFAAHAIKCQRCAFFSNSMEKYRLDTLLDPRVDQVPPFAIPDYVIPAYASDDEGPARAVVDFIEEAWREGRFLISVDPTLPRAENLERIGKSYDAYIHEHQTKVKEIRIDRPAYAELLRLIDAKHAGAKWDQVAELINLHNGSEEDSELLVFADNVKDRYKAVREVCKKLTGLEWPRERQPRTQSAPPMKGGSRSAATRSTSKRKA